MIAQYVIHALSLFVLVRLVFREISVRALERVVVLRDEQLETARQMREQWIKRWQRFEKDPRTIHEDELEAPPRPHRGGRT